MRSAVNLATCGVASLLLAGVASCSGCHVTPGATTGKASPDSTEPTVRLYLMSDMAGALEPCGCTKDQLGGLDHAGAYIESEKTNAPRYALLTAGPTFYMEDDPKADHLAQDTAKANTIAQSFKGLGFVAFAPGRNDWVGSTAQLAHLGDASGGALLFANAAPGESVPRGTVPTFVKDFGGTKVGFIGVSAPDKDPSAKPFPGLASTPSGAAVKKAWSELHDKGVGIVVALASVGRGEAKRIADEVPGLTAVVVGSTGSAGDVNTKPPQPERVGDVLILETGNHLTTLGVLDLFVREGGTSAASFADATGLELAQKRAELQGRIDELHLRISAWERDNTIAKADLDARRADLAKLETERAALDTRPPPAQGSFFRYASKEVRDAMGRDASTAAAMLAYYKAINQTNKSAFDNRLPLPHDAKSPGYLGVEACTNCHDEARAVWDKTAHAHAYKTLSDEFKEYNLDCVSCHVTGYDLPGGSTVSHVDNLKDVQCEVCHGAGSLHAARPEKVAMPIPKPTADSCLGCHHAPHVENFDAVAKMASILGPGHGRTSDGGAK